MSQKSYSLSRCPFCNCHDLVLDVSVSSYHIRCFQCGAMGPRSLTTIEGAAARWNWGGADNPSSLIATVARKESITTNRNDKKNVEL